MPRCAESFITRTHLPWSLLSKRGAFPSGSKNTGLSSLQSKFFLFLTERSFTLLPSNRGGPPWPALSFPGLNGLWVQGFCRQQTHVIPRSGHTVWKRWCEWLEGKTHGYHVTGKNSHFFIYFLPSVTNSKNRPLLGSHNSREQDKFFKNSNWETVDLIGVHLANNSKGSPAGLGKDSGGL